MLTSSHVITIQLDSLTRLYKLFYEIRALLFTYLYTFSIITRNTVDNCKVIAFISKTTNNIKRH